MESTVILGTYVETIDFGVQNTRIQSAFQRNGIETLRDLCQLRKNELDRLYGIGFCHRNDIERTLTSLGLKIGMSAEEITRYDRLSGATQADENNPLPEGYSGIDWEGRRYELAKELYMKKSSYTEESALNAVIAADALINTLRGFEN